MDQSILLKARALIGESTPMEADCGDRCGAACCRADEDGNGGMFLFPGEEALLRDASWCKIDPRGAFFAPIAVCDGTCDRASRPLACRIFPLTPAFIGGALKVRVDARARALCPLSDYGVRGMKKEFAQGVLRAMRLIASDPEGAEFLRNWQALEEEFRHFSL